MATEWYLNETPEESIEVESASSSYVPDEANTDIYNYQSKNLLASVDPSFETTWRSFWGVTGTNASVLNEYGFNSSTYVVDGDYAGGVFADGTPVTSTYSLRTSVSGVDTPATLTETVAAQGTYTLSFHAWANTYVSSLTVRVVPYISGVAQPTAYNSSVSVSNTLTKKSVSFTLPVNTDSVFVSFTTPSVTTGAYGYVFTIDALQLEVGSAATDFEVNSSFTEILSSDTYKIRIGNVITDAPYFYVHSDGTTYASRFRLKAGEVSLGSTSHGFQIGDSSGLNIRMDSNEFQAVNNSAASALNINNNGGNLNLGGSGTSTTINGSSVTLGTTTQFIGQDIYDSTSGTTANVIVGSAGRLRRITSTQSVKYDIYNLSNNQISSSIDISKISSNRLFDPYSVLDLSSVSFSLINDERSFPVIGFIAEDIADKAPELAEYDDNGNPIYFNIGGIAAAMLVVLQDQQNKINSLEERLAILEG